VAGGSPAAGGATGARDRPGTGTRSEPHLGRQSPRAPGRDDDAPLTSLRELLGEEEDDALFREADEAATEAFAVGEEPEPQAEPMGHEPLFEEMQQVVGVGPARASRLLEAYGSREALIAADPDEVAERAAIPPELAARLRDHLGAGDDAETDEGAAEAGESAGVAVEDAGEPVEDGEVPGR
jgi:hypothetical protein